MLYRAELRPVMRTRTIHTGEGGRNAILLEVRRTAPAGGEKTSRLTGDSAGETEAVELEQSFSQPVDYEGTMPEPRKEKSL